MTRFHVHVGVPDLDTALGFYTDLFATAPVVRRDDYARWVLDDPALTFAITVHPEMTGVRHLGFQAASDDELSTLRGRAERAVTAAAGTGIRDEGETECCYAHSVKHWVSDPGGVLWEHFHTLGSADVLGCADDSTCCTVAPDAGPAPVTACGDPGAGDGAACC